LNPNFFLFGSQLVSRVQQKGISGLIPSLDLVVKVADPAFIPQDSWLRGIVEGAMIPAASAILLFALCCALIQEQRLAASGASDFTKVL